MLDLLLKVQQTRIAPGTGKFTQEKKRVSKRFNTGKEKHHKTKMLYANQGKRAAQNMVHCNLVWSKQGMSYNNIKLFKQLH